VHHRTFLPILPTPALRLYPVFPYHIRVALADTTLPKGGGPDGQSPIYVQAGALFNASFIVLHRLPFIWGPDAHDFNPDRWDSFKPKTWEFSPFGGGPRACVGRQKALMETSYLVVKMLRAFQAVEPRDDRDWVGQVQITAKNLNGCKVALIPA
jgi:cytochrome P450